jgi:hypothetical protein
MVIEYLTNRYFIAALYKLPKNVQWISESQNKFAKIVQNYTMATLHTRTKKISHYQSNLSSPYFPQRVLKENSKLTESKIWSQVSHL